MSANEIMLELETLAPAERRAVAMRALELNWDLAEREAMEWAEVSGGQLAQFIDQDEAASESR